MRAKRHRDGEVSIRLTAAERRDLTAALHILDAELGYDIEGAPEGRGRWTLERMKRLVLDLRRLLVAYR